MKKKLLVVLAVAMLVFAFTACGGKDMSDSPNLGTWEATTASMSGISVSMDTIGGAWVMELGEDGKCKMTFNGKEDTLDWEDSEKGFIVDGDYEIVVDGNTGTMDYEGMTINFEKK